MKPWILGVALCVLAVNVMPAQQVEPPQELAALREPVADAAALPDSPGAVRSLSIPAFAVEGDARPQQQGTVAPQIAQKYARTIGADMTAETWGAKEKFVASLRKQVSFGGLFSPVVTAGFQQLRDSRPHYGTDSGAYGARIGAAYARQSTQSFLAIGLLPALLHDDPRYYVLGPTHTFKSRVIYAAERVFITRKDDGSNAANIPLFAGVVGSQGAGGKFLS